MYLHTCKINLPQKPAISIDVLSPFEFDMSSIGQDLLFYYSFFNYLQFKQIAILKFNMGVFNKINRRHPQYSAWHPYTYPSWQWFPFNNNQLIKPTGVRFMALHRSYTLTPDEEACHSGQIWFTSKNSMRDNHLCWSFLRSNLNSNILTFPNKFIQNTNYIKSMPKEI